MATKQPSSKKAQAKRARVKKAARTKPGTLRGAGNATSGAAPFGTDLPRGRILQRPDDRNLAFDLAAPKTIRVGEFHGKQVAMDDMLFLGLDDPERAKQLLTILADDLGHLVQSLELWGRAEHVPVVASRARRMLANTIRRLANGQHVRKASSALTKSADFRSVWDATTPNAGRSNYCALGFFDQEIMRCLETECRLAVTERTSEEAPSYRMALRKLAADIKKRSPTHPPDIKTTDLLELEARVLRNFLLIDRLFEIVWKDILMPLARERWPAFYDRHQNTKFLNGAPLLSKRDVYGKPISSISKWQSEIKNSLRRAMQFYRCHENTHQA